MTPPIRLAITGVGAITPAGATAAETWEALLAGRSGIARIAGFDAAGSRPDYAGEVKDLSHERAGLPRRKLKMMGRQAQLAFAATQEAFHDAGLHADAAACDRARLGIVFGVGMLNADVDELGRTLTTMHRATGNGFETAAFTRAAATEMLPLWLLRHIPNLAAAHAAIAIDAQGPSNTIATGCVAGANAIGEAARIVARGDADVVIAGGADARVSPLAMLRYRQLGWMSTRGDCPIEAVSAPFDADASGFVTAEAGAVIVIESAEHAARRGARVRAELVAYAAANDAGGMTPGSGGSGAIRRTLTRAAAALGDGDAIGCLFAAASGLPAIDAACAEALRDVRAGAIAATRGALGHTHAASAAVDAVMAVHAIESGRVPPMLNLRRPIAPLPFGREARSTTIDTALVSAYGFGGHAAALGLRRWRA